MAYNGAASVDLPTNTVVAGIAGDRAIDPASGNTLDFSWADSAADLNHAEQNFDFAFDALGQPVPFTAASHPLFVDDILHAFAVTADYADLTFNNLANFPTADIKLYGVDNLSSVDGSQYAGAASFPGGDLAPSGNGYESYTVLNANAWYMTPAAETGGASYRLSTIIHELGHVLGLAHPFDAGNGSRRWSGLDSLDTARYTIMSYDSDGNVAATAGEPATFMAVDVAALHHLYGSADNNAGPTVYRLTDPGTVRLDIDGDDGDMAVGAAYAAIWDTGGTDGIRYDGSQRVVINLNAATLDTETVPADIAGWRSDLTGSAIFSGLPARVRDELTDPGLFAGGFISRVFDTGFETGGYAIASDAFADQRHRGRTDIENAVGGARGDVLVGGTVANVLNGRDGADFLHGSHGDDVLRGGYGDDELFGGVGGDDQAGQPGSDSLHGGDGPDTLAGGGGADSLRGEGGDDVLDGHSDADTLSGGAGDDTLTGRQQADVLDGGDGGDRLNGGTGADILDGGEGADRLHGHPGADMLSGGPGADTVIGHQNADTIDGGAGDDRLVGGSGADTIGGTDGWDRINAGPGDDSLSGGAHGDTLQGARGDDEVSGDGGDDLIRGAAGSDTLEGGAGDDILTGFRGNDVLFGGDGNDMLNAGAGSDTVTGGPGADRFRVLSGSETTEIADFDSAEDRLDLRDFGLPDEDALDSASGGDAAGLILNLGSDVVTMPGVPAAALADLDVLI